MSLSSNPQGDAMSESQTHLERREGEDDECRAGPLTVVLDK
jgi:hypothetical protein